MSRTFAEAAERLTVLCVSRRQFSVSSASSLLLSAYSHIQYKKKDWLPERDNSKTRCTTCTWYQWSKKRCKIWSKNYEVKEMALRGSSAGLSQALGRSWGNSAGLSQSLGRKKLTLDFYLLSLIFLLGRLPVSTKSLPKSGQDDRAPKGETTALPGASRAVSRCNVTCW